MNRSVLIAIILAIILVGAGGAYVVLSSNNNPQGKTFDVRIGYLQGDLHQFARLVAMDDTINGGTNLYKENGLNVSTPNLSGYTAGGAVMDAFAANDIDIGFLGGPPAILKSLNVGTDIIIVALVNMEGSSIIAEDGITNFTQLKGKTVATPGTSSIQHLLFLNEVERYGMNAKQAGTSGDENTVYFVTIAPKDMKAALDTNQVNAIIGWEPFGSDVLLDHGGNLIEWSGDVWPNHPCCVVAVKRSFAETNPETVERFLRAHVAANILINETLAEGSGAKYDMMIQLAMTFSGRNASVVESSFDHMVLDYRIQPNLRTYLIDFTQSYIDLGLIAQSKLTDRGYATVPEYVDDLIQPQYLTNATK